MRAIDNYTDKEIEMLTLKGMTSNYEHERHVRMLERLELCRFDAKREHDHDLEEESRRDAEQNESEGQ